MGDPLPPPHNYKCSSLKPLFELLKLLKLHFAENVCYYVCKSMSLDCANLFTQQQMARPSAGWGSQKIQFGANYRNGLMFCLQQNLDNVGGSHHHTNTRPGDRTFTNVHVVGFNFLYGTLL